MWDLGSPARAAAHLHSLLLNPRPRAQCLSLGWKNHRFWSAADRWDMSVGAAFTVCWLRISWVAHGTVGSDLLKTRTIFIIRFIWAGILGEKAQPIYRAPCCSLELLLFEWDTCLEDTPRARTIHLLLMLRQDARHPPLHSKCLTSCAAMRESQTIAEPGCAPHTRADRWDGYSTIFQKQSLVYFSSRDSFFSQIMSQVAVQKPYLLWSRFYSAQSLTIGMWSAASLGPLWFLALSPESCSEAFCSEAFLKSCPESSPEMWDAS